MPVKPSANEQEYFARLEAEKKRKQADEARAKLAQEEREQAKQLHYMKCPKCGMPLEEIAVGDVKVDKCFACEGMWFDKGEVEAMKSKEPGFIGRLLGVFGS